MARLARLYAPNTPQLLEARFVPEIVGQGAALGRAAHWLSAELRGRPVSLHAWVVLPERLIALATPTHREGIPRWMQGIGRRLAAEQGGGVFAGRYRSTLLQPGQWVMPAMLWLETLPVTAGLVPDAEQWRLGSAAYHTGLDGPGAVVDHADYWASGNTPFDRQASHRRALRDGLGSTQRTRIESALQGQWALGDPVFIQEATAESRRAAPAKRGRPPMKRPENAPT